MGGLISLFVVSVVGVIGGFRNFPATVSTIFLKISYLFRYLPEFPVALPLLAAQCDHRIHFHRASRRKPARQECEHFIPGVVFYSPGHGLQ